MLHITNGESVQIRDTGLPGRIVYWNDLLHEGPVPWGLSLRELSRIRESFIAGFFGMPASEVSFRERDDALDHSADHEEVVLWFEHDLYDQLQLIQILDWCSEQNPGSTKLSLIGTEVYFGSLRPETLRSLFETRRPVSAAQFDVAKRAWSAFRQPEPVKLLDFWKSDISALPFYEERCCDTCSSSRLLTMGCPGRNARSCKLPRAVHAGSMSFSKQTNVWTSRCSWEIQRSRITFMVWSSPVMLYCKGQDRRFKSLHSDGRYSKEKKITCD